MTTRRTWAIAALSAALLMACGGGDPYVAGSVTPNGGPKVAPSATGPTFGYTSVVSFGDSLSDVGTYAPKAAPLGGKFTTNSATATIWVQNIATQLNLSIAPAQTGFGPDASGNGAIAVTPCSVANCTGYGQGGSRVTNPNGIGHSTGALTIPVTTQVQNHLDSHGGKFAATDLIFVWAGANDALVQIGNFGAAATQILTAKALGTLTADAANSQLLGAQLVAQGEMKKAATELVALIKNQIIANGGTYVAVVSVPDIGATPLGATPAVAPVKSVLSSLSEVFNLWLREGLKDQPVQWIDAADILAKVIANPAAAGFANVTTPACDIAKISFVTGGAVLDGSSLFCNSTPVAQLNGITAGADATTWLFADTVHPTTGGHAAISTAFTAKLRGFGWIN